MYAMELVVQAMQRSCLKKAPGSDRNNSNRKMDAELLILGPALAPLSRIKGIYRIQLLLKGATRNEVRKVLGAISNRPQSGVRQILDVDPISML